MVTLILSPSQPPRINSNRVCSCCLLIRSSYGALATWTLPGVTGAFSQHGNWPSPEECDEVISKYNTLDWIMKFMHKSEKGHSHISANEWMASRRCCLYNRIFSCLKGKLWCMLQHEWTLLLIMPVLIRQLQKDQYCVVPRPEAPSAVYLHWCRKISPGSCFKLEGEVTARNGLVGVVCMLKEEKGYGDRARLWPRDSANMLNTTGLPA